MADAITHDLTHYLVGGAVRDAQLGRRTTDRDWVVVGSTPADLLARGFRPVGQDFPVFIHPHTGEEYALARTERKTAPGYTGFQFHAAPDVSLEDDLTRRDLTINAIAQTTDGTLIDPHHGVRDLEQRWLRHVSPAFVEDPLRVLRTARFAAQLAPFGFRLAPETRQLMAQISQSGELAALSAERVWQETQRALAAPCPRRYFQILREIGGLKTWFPELDALFGVPQPPQYHPEIDTGDHCLRVLDQIAALTPAPIARFAALVHDLGKGTTPPEMWPSHRGHEKRGAKLVHELCDRLKIPNDYRRLGTKTAEFHTHVHRAAELRSTTLLQTLEKLDAFRRPADLDHLLFACEADARGRPGFENRAYPQPERFRQALAAAQAVKPAMLDLTGLSGPVIGQRIRAARLSAIRAQHATQQNCES